MNDVPADSIIFVSRRPRSFVLIGWGMCIAKKALIKLNCRTGFLSICGTVSGADALFYSSIHKGWIFTRSRYEVLAWKLNRMEWKAKNCIYSSSFKNFGIFLPYLLENNKHSSWYAVEVEYYPEIADGLLVSSEIGQRYVSFESDFFFAPLL